MRSSVLPWERSPALSFPFLLLPLSLLLLLLVLMERRKREKEGQRPLLPLLPRPSLEEAAEQRRR